MNRVAIIAAIIFSSTRLTSAQPTTDVFDQINLCRTIKGDIQRLKCFDEIVVDKTQVGAVDRNIHIEVAWKIDESKLPTDNNLQMTATLPALRSDIALRVRCQEKATDVAILKPYGYLGSDPIKVFVGFNNGKLIETRWSPAMNGMEAFAPSPAQFINALSDNGRLFIRAFASNGNYFDGEFLLGNVSEIRKKIAQACNLNPP